jgi:uncharacterized protein YbaR (Trm112 family)
MTSNTKLPDGTVRMLRCPVCRSTLGPEGDQLVCANPQCGSRFPIVAGIPVLINEANSIFAIEDFVARRHTTDVAESGIKRAVASRLPGIDLNLKARANYARFAQLLLEGTDQASAASSPKDSGRPRVLIVGGGEVGKGLRELLAMPAFEFTETDVNFGPRTMIICDGHDLPFEDGSFDGVIIQAVLEHVVDPYRCVEEIHRVLKKDALVYAETPFMQQVHGGRYDFTRFTYLGHRRLFRRFEEVASGVMCGPGMALAWSLRYFLFAFIRSRTARLAATVLTRVTLFWVKYFDYYLVDKPGSLDGASGYFFMGRKSDRVLSDRELIRLYKGIF